MKKLLYIAVTAIAVLSSCASDDVVIADSPLTPQVTEAPVFTAITEGDASTRTALADGSAVGKKRVAWENGDQIQMVFSNSSSYSAYPFVTYTATPGTDATIATLSIKEGETFPEDVNFLYSATYPANTMVKGSGVPSFVFPATQEYGGDGKMTNVPMLYYYNHPEFVIPKTVTFQNPTAVLAVTVPYGEMNEVKSITVSSDLVMNGKVYLGTDTDGKKFYYIDINTQKTDANCRITLDCYTKAGKNVQITEAKGKTFYIAILPMSASLKGAHEYNTMQASSYGYLQIDVTDGTSTKSMRTKEGVSISVERNRIYNLTFASQTQP